MSICNEPVRPHFHTSLFCLFPIVMFRFDLALKYSTKAVELLPADARLANMHTSVLFKLGQLNVGFIELHSPPPHACIQTPLLTIDM